MTWIVALLIVAAAALGLGLFLDRRARHQILRGHILELLDRVRSVNSPQLRTVRDTLDQQLEALLAQARGRHGAPRALEINLAQVTSEVEQLEQVVSEISADRPWVACLREWITRLESFPEHSAHGVLRLTAEEVLRQVLEHLEGSRVQDAQQVAEAANGRIERRFKALEHFEEDIAAFKVETEPLVAEALEYDAPNLLPHRWARMKALEQRQGCKEREGDLEEAWHDAMMVRDAAQAMVSELSNLLWDRIVAQAEAVQRTLVELQEWPPGEEVLEEESRGLLEQMMPHDQHTGEMPGTLSKRIEALEALQTATDALVQKHRAVWECWEEGSHPSEG